MARPRLLITREIPATGLELLRSEADLDIWLDPLPPPRDELLRRAEGIDGILTLLTDRIDRELLDRAGDRLRVVSNFAVGVDNVDLTACTERGIPVGYTPGVLTETTADLAFALLMAAARRLVEGSEYVRAGRWQTWGPQLLLGRDIHHATLGIVGFGRIGREMAKRARGFEMRVLYHSRQMLSSDQEYALGVKAASLEELFSESDFVSLHTNLTPETHHLLDRRAFERMKPTAILINTSRGPVVDQVALTEALRSGQIAGAALDVTDPEPMTSDDPLLLLPNCLVVPHIASASVVTRGRMSELAARNLLAGLRGEPLPASANPEVYERMTEASDRLIQNGHV